MASGQRKLKCPWCGGTDVRDTGPAPPDARYSAEGGKRATRSKRRSYVCLNPKCDRGFRA